jgi:hypothetical protein
MILLAAVGLVAPACGGDDTTGPNGNGSGIPGTFQASVTGDLTLSFSGGAVFGTLSDGGTTDFAIGMVHGVLGQENSDAIYIGRDNNAAPGTGTYPIHPGNCGTCTADDFSGAYVYQATAAQLGAFVSDTGEFTITSASADTLRGTFDFSASLFLGVGITADSVRLEGSFTAVAGQVPASP